MAVLAWKFSGYVNVALEVTPYFFTFVIQPTP